MQNSPELATHSILAVGICVSENAARVVVHDAIAQNETLALGTTKIKMPAHTQKAES